MSKNKVDGNVRSKENEPRPWSKKEMDEAKPYPIPEIDDDNEENDKQRKDKNEDAPC